MNFIVPDEEKYICGQCEETVAGGRYNNHCPHCLWSKHLDDRVPGDRVSTCQALMEPVGVTLKKGKWRIVHQCIGCQKHTVVDSAPEDDIDLVIKLSHLPLPDDFLNNKALRRLPRSPTAPPPAYPSDTLCVKLICRG